MRLLGGQRRRLLAAAIVTGGAGAILAVAGLLGALVAWAARR
jgi:hypothetical protein